jgi:hypothetical protein
MVTNIFLHRIKIRALWSHFDILVAANGRQHCLHNGLKYVSKMFQNESIMVSQDIYLVARF